MELRPAALRLVLQHGLPAVVSVRGGSMAPTIELGAKVDVWPLAPEEALGVGDVVLVATSAADVLLLHRVMHVFEEGARQLVMHQGDAASSTFATCAREDVIARMTGFAGDGARAVPTLDQLDAAGRARFRRRRRACAAYARGRGLARALGLADLAFVKRCAAAYRRFARALLG